ncbi:MAG: DUF962 domain-containing protein [Litorimonas sp.]
MKKITTYSEFWPHYLREHSKASTRAWHYVGTLMALTLLAALIITGKWALLPLTLVSGYFFAWMSHGLIEKNKPATFTYPLWSLGSDFKMLFCAVTGKMPKELEKAGVEI